MLDQNDKILFERKPVESIDDYIDRIKSEHARIAASLRMNNYELQRMYRSLQKEFESTNTGIAYKRVVPMNDYRSNTIRNYQVVEKVYKCSADMMQLSRLSDDDKYSLLQELLTHEIVKDKGLPVEIKIDTKLGIAYLRVNFCRATDIPTDKPIIQYIQ